MKRERDRERDREREIGSLMLLKFNFSIGTTKLKKSMKKVSMKKITFLIQKYSENIKGSHTQRRF
jgi:hypothetical protein